MRGAARGLIVLWLLAAAAGPLHALSPDRMIGQYPRTTWGRTEGLPFSGVTALTVTTDGYLWIGTQEGLARFDGIRFAVFDKRSSTAFEDHFITSLAAGADGDLWIGTRRGLVLRRAGDFFRFGTAEGLPNEYVRELLTDRGGRLWIGTYGGGLALWGRGAVERVWGEADGLLDASVRALREDPDGSLWIGTSEGLHRLAPPNGDGGSGAWALTAYTRDDGLPSDFIRALEVDGEGRLWIGTEGGGLARHLGEGRFAAVAEPEVRTVGALLADRDGCLWIGSHGEGLWRLRGGEAEAWTAAGGLPHDTVWTLLVDAEDSLWVGTRGGLVHLWDGVATSITSAQGLSSDDVRTLYQDRQGTLWIGGGGLDRWADGRLLPPPPALTLSLVSGPGRDEVRTLLETRDGALWLGTPHGLKRFDGRWVQTFDAARGLAHGAVNALVEDRDGRLWIGTAGGLSRYEGEGRFTTWTAADGLPDDSVRALWPDPSGGVWVGTEAGLARWHDGLQPLAALGDLFVLTLYQDPRGVLWIGTSGDGLLRWEDRGTAPSEGAGPAGLLRYRMRDGLFNDLIFQILEDAEGGLWMSSSKGVFRVTHEDLDRFARGESKQLVSHWLDESDGMASAECNGGTQPSGWRAADGRLWFATDRGAVVIDPAEPFRLRAPPPVVIEEVRVDGEVRELRSPVQVGPGGGSLEIHYTAPSFIAPSKVRFRYRLEGFHPEDRWEQAGDRRAAFFTGLPPGEYRFEVTAAYAEGAWQSAGAVLELELIPFFYQTFWFLVVLALTLVLAGVLVYHLRVRALRRRQLELEHLVDLRTQELEQANRELARLAIEDDLTGVPNHRKLQHSLEEEWRRAVRSGKPLALLMIDIDHFKVYNDSYGHQRGDRCLREVALTLAGCVHRPGDLVARYGGEEFAAVLPGTGAEAARRLGEAMRRAVEELDIEHAGSPGTSKVTVSVGVSAVVATRDQTPDALLAAADQALYRAKALGRNRVEVAEASKGLAERAP